MIDEAFGIRCPQSILNATDIFKPAEAESCTYGSNRLNDTTFCGRCAKRNVKTLFRNFNSSLDYKYVCFAYKLTAQELTTLSFDVLDYYGNVNSFSAAITTIADRQWHYKCVDLAVAYLKANPSTAASKLLSLRVFQVKNSHLLSCKLIKKC